MNTKPIPYLDGIENLPAIVHTINCQMAEIFDGNGIAGMDTEFPQVTLLGNGEEWAVKWCGMPLWDSANDDRACVHGVYGIPGTDPEPVPLEQHIRGEITKLVDLMHRLWNANRRREGYTHTPGGWVKA